MKKYKILRVLTPTVEQLKVIIQLLPSESYKSEVLVFQSNTEMVQLSFLAITEEVKSLDKYNPVILDHLEDKPFNFQCYYKDISFKRFFVYISNILNLNNK